MLSWGSDETKPMKSSALICIYAFHLSPSLSLFFPLLFSLFTFHMQMICVDHHLPRPTHITYVISV